MSTEKKKNYFPFIAKILKNKSNYHKMMANSYVLENKFSSKIRKSDREYLKNMRELLNIENIMKKSKKEVTEKELDQLHEYFETLIDNYEFASYIKKSLKNSLNKSFTEQLKSVIMNFMKIGVNQLNMRLIVREANYISHVVCSCILKSKNDNDIIDLISLINNIVIINLNNYHFIDIFYSYILKEKDTIKRIFNIKSDYHIEKFMSIILTLKNKQDMKIFFVTLLELENNNHLKTFIAIILESQNKEDIYMITDIILAIHQDTQHIRKFIDVILETKNTQYIKRVIDVLLESNKKQHLEIFIDVISKCYNIQQLEMIFDIILQKDVIESDDKFSPEYLKKIMTTISHIKYPYNIQVFTKLYMTIFMRNMFKKENKSHFRVVNENIFDSSKECIQNFFEVLINSDKFIEYIRRISMINKEEFNISLSFYINKFIELGLNNLNYLLISRVSDDIKGEVIACILETKNNVSILGIIEFIELCSVVNDDNIVKIFNNYIFNNKDNVEIIIALKSEEHKRIFMKILFESQDKDHLEMFLKILFESQDKGHLEMFAKILFESQDHKHLDVINNIYMENIQYVDSFLKKYIDLLDVEYKKHFLKERSDSTISDRPLRENKMDSIMERIISVEEDSSIENFLKVPKKNLSHIHSIRSLSTDTQAISI